MARFTFGNIPTDVAYWNMSHLCGTQLAADGLFYVEQHLAGAVKAGSHGFKRQFRATSGGGDRRTPLQLQPV
jgi:hypothetical protein